MPHNANTKKFIGGYIGFVREIKAIDRIKLAAELNMSYQNLWDIEKGYRGVSCETFDLLLNKLNTTEDEYWGYMPQYLAHRKTSQQNNKPLTQNNKP